MPLLNNDLSKPVKPSEFAEAQIITAILDKSYPPGKTLPSERLLASSLGVTRPTVRETLQKLAREGWVTIAHGKPTRVNDFLSQGGLGALTTLARHGAFLPDEIVSHLLQARTLILPEVTQLAVQKNPDAILNYLETFPETPADAAAFTRFDWGLQLLLVDTAGNLVFKMMFNDFTAVYQLMGERYFASNRSQKASRRFYQDLGAAVQDRKSHVPVLVAEAMKEAQAIWETLS